MSKLKNLVPDIYKIFEGNHKVSDGNLELLAEGIKETVESAVNEAGCPRPFFLRMSNIGTKDRKLWYMSRDEDQSVHSPSTHIKFLYGHILEHLLLFFVREAGYKTSHEQEEIEVDGVPGHMDVNIEGIPVDIKSASSFGFQKFAKGNIINDDPFGYLEQLAGYNYKFDSEVVGFLVIDKTHGSIVFCEVDDICLPDIEERIKDVKAFLEKEEPPQDLCFPVNKHDNGNEEINNNCKYCKYKFECFEDLRVFKYSTGYKYFSKIEKEPKVEEIL